MSAPRSLRWILALCLLTIPALLFSYGLGPPPPNHTGGFGESTCVECHGTGLNPSSGRVTISAPSTYQPNTTAPIQVTITDTSGGRGAWGFEMSARFRSGAQAGNFSAGGNIAVQTATWRSFNIQYASHNTAARVGGSTFTFTVNWTAPADGSGGDVVFDANGNAANGNNASDAGDHIYMAEVTAAAPPSNPVPAVSSISPSSATAGGAGFTLTVNGSNFISGAVVRWNGSDRSTTFVNNSQLTAAITAADIAAGGTAQVTVFNPAPGGGTSSALTFTINNPLPAITSLAPSAASAGGPAFTLTVNGSNFISSSLVRWNGSDRSTTFVSNSQLTAAIPAGDIAAAGTAQVTVFNPAPGGGTSTARTFTINNPANIPAITLLAPSAAPPGGPAFTLTVYGSNFASGSVVNWNGSSRTTTFVSSTQLTAAITASDIGTSATAQVTVSTPGGGVSSPLAFTISSGGSIPSIPANGIVNAAGFQAGLAVAPGGIAAIFGSNLATQLQSASIVPLPATLAGTTLRFNGNVAVPLFFVFSGQVNIQFPWELTGQAQASLTDTVNGTTGSPTTVTVGQFSPGLFSTNSQGTGQGAILIAGTGTVAAVSGSLGDRDARPVKRGEEFIAIFATGLGDVTNRPASGAIGPFQPPLAETLTKPTVTIGGVQVATSDIPFSGLAPFFVGLYQVNAKVPADAPTGNAVEVVVTIGGVSSNRVTIAVQ